MLLSGAISFDTRPGHSNTVRFFTVMDPDEIAAKKGGREKGSSAYTSMEHEALLSIISEVPDASNASESSSQREAVYKQMVAEFYLSGSAQTSSALHGHFVDLYGAFKQVICNL
jgi:hypothetical protein